MSEFFKSRFDEIFQIDDSGYILKLSIDSGEWKVVSELKEADLSCKPCSAIHLNNILLAIYFRKSENIALANGLNSFGKDYSFFYNLGCIYSVDENDNEYICNRDFMSPVKKGTVNKNWETVSSDVVFEKINKLDPYFIKELELYIFETDDINSFFKHFSDKVPHGVLERLAALYSYLKKSCDSGKASGVDFIFYKNNFGCIYAKDEKHNEYVCNEDFLVPVKRNIIKNTWDIVDKYSVIELIKKHSKHKKDLPSKKIEICDLDLYISKKYDIGGIAEDGREFRLSKITGELEQVKKGHGFGAFWKKCSGIQAVKFQFKKREEYKGISALNKYLKMCNDIELKKSGKKIGMDFTFYKNDFGRIFAKDNKYNEYVCEESYMIPILNKGSGTYMWDTVEPSQVTYMIKAYADMVRGICEKNQNLKDIHKYIKANEKKELEKTGNAFGYNFRFFVNSVGNVFAKDENNREYFCKPQEMSFAESGTIDERNWDTILESEVIKYLR